MKLYTATLDANDEYLEIYVANKATVVCTITSTITVTPRFSHDGATFVALTDEALTASGTMLLEGPGVYRLVASSVSGGGSAAVSAQG